MSRVNLLRSKRWIRRASIRVGCLLPITFISLVIVRARPACAELPLKYLPDKPDIILSLAVQDLYDGALSQILKKEIPGDTKLQRGEEAATGDALENIARVTVAVNIAGDVEDSAITIVIQTLKAVTAESIRNTIKPGSDETDFRIEEVKVGDYTIYDPTYRLKHGRSGERFHHNAVVVVASNVILEGSGISRLRGILQRGKTAELGATLQSALKNADSSKTLLVAIDIRSLAAEKRILEVFELLELNGNVLKQFESLAVDGNLKGDAAVMRATLVCKCAAAAADATKIAEGAQVMLRKMIEASPRAPKDVAESVNSVAFAVEDAKVKADGKVKVDSLVKWWRAENEYATRGVKQSEREPEQARPR